MRAIEPGEPSAAICARVVAARDRQLACLRPFGLRCNAEMPSAVQRATCKPDSLGERTLAGLIENRRSFTARSIDRLIKVVRIIADLLSQDDIDVGGLLETAAYRDTGVTILRTLRALLPTATHGATCPLPAGPACAAESRFHALARKAR